MSTLKNISIVLFILGLFAITASIEYDAERISDRISGGKDFQLACLEETNFVGTLETHEAQTPQTPPISAEIRTDRGASCMFR
ncbi:MAG: hypothetical protein FWD67_08545 [Betaproteobacteria bacterium]|nr:hypothetical protein [Betaproteobacteria bacterium]